MGAKAFKSHHGTWLTAEEGVLKATHHLEGHHSHFHVENHGHYHTIRTHFSKYLSETADHKVVLHHDQHHADTHWIVEHHGGKVALKSHHGHYIGVDHHGNVHTHHERGNDQLFEEISV